MDAFPFDPFGFVGGIIAVSILIRLLTTGLILGTIVWAIRRSAPRHEDPAVAELKTRLAHGEIGPIEYQVGMRALGGDDD